MTDGIRAKFARLRTFTVVSIGLFRDYGYEGLEASTWWRTLRAPPRIIKTIKRDKEFPGWFASTVSTPGSDSYTASERAIENPSLSLSLGP